MPKTTELGLTWRLLLLSANAAAFHMAVDEAVLRAYAEDRVPPTLRFYTWNPPGVSCGRFQDIGREVDLEACAALGFDVVRRPTGGRAVLHKDDLTYAVVIGEKDGLPAGTIPSYRWLSRGLLAGLTRLGAAAELHTPEPGRRPRAGGPSCFASPSWYELTVGGRKVAGSAQRREGGNVLQHGSIPIEFSPRDVAQVLRPRGGVDLAAVLPGAAAGLGEFVPGLEPGRLAEALAEGFAEALGVELAPGGLTEWERELVEQLKPKYEGVGD